MNGRDAFGNFDPLTGEYTNPDTHQKMPGFIPNPQAAQLPPWMFNPEDSSVFRPQPGKPLPEGVMTPQQLGGGNAKEEASEKSAGKALDYANTYRTAKHTGPGDEALQDQFFELAKPSTGFRMNQAQIDQLHSMQNWVNSVEGAAYHAKYGTWFSDPQRDQIIDTMGALGRSKGAKLPGGQERNTAPPTANVKRFNPATGRLE
jgi:hypothetical protein